jgi:exosortase A
LWLIWQKRKHLAAYQPQPMALFLTIVVMSLVAWALARLTGVQVVEQAAFVGVIIGSWAAILGFQVSRFLLFPLMFLFFAVPMGEDLVPPMMEFTASFTVTALELTGIPVYREGLFFSLPSGNWSVVEACSGVRYLIASITLGVMYAYITYHTLWKRLLFIAMSAIVPIFANGVRAYMIVMIGHLSGMEYATGVDHLIYGWFFFGIVMFILFWVGSFWQETEEAPQPVAPLQAMTHSSAVRKVIVVAVTSLVMAAAVTWATNRALTIEPQISCRLVAPAVGDGWQYAERTYRWGAAHQPSEFVLDETAVDGPVAVRLQLVLFPKQRQGQEAISPANKVAGEATRLVALGRRALTLNGERFDVVQEKILVKNGGRDEEHLVWRWYRVAGSSLSNRYEGKAREAWARIYPGRADGAWIALSTPFSSPDIARHQQVLEAFAQSAMPGLYAEMDRLLGISE